MRVFRGIVFLLLVLVSLTAGSQSVSSVYSNRGIGLINYQGLPHNLGMGEIGLAVPTTWNLNYANPAFLPLNAATTFQVGVEMDRRNITSESLSSKRVSGGLRYLNLGFPVINNKWSSAIGISPYSTVNNKSFSNATIEDDITTSTYYQGSGGLTSFSWSNGFRFGPSLYAGIRSSAMFGSIEELESIVINDGAAYLVNFTDRTSYSGLKFDLALGYRKFFGEEKALNLGLVYEIARDLNGSHDQRMEQLSGSSVISELLLVENELTTFTLPSSVGIGSSYQILNKLTVGTDITYTNWSSAGDGTQEFFNTLKVGFGAQFTPDYTSVSSYLKRATYRAGFSIGNLPFEVNGFRINELGINFGGSLPVGYSNLDWAFKYGRLGTLENDLIRENYFRIVIGATMTDRWFIKRRYD